MNYHCQLLLILTTYHWKGVFSAPSLNGHRFLSSLKKACQRVTTIFLSSTLSTPYDLQKSFSSLQLSHSVVSNSLWPDGLQHARPPCPPTPKVYSNSCPLSRWCHSAISPAVFPLFSHLQSFPASESFPVSRLVTSGGQSTGASASVLPLFLTISILYQG